ncbi:MAG: hypothetical protein KA059_09170 [Elusimicrobiales bacterium]|nr:hypothetical protein [Elusimicrobiales bacterium]
MEPVFNYSKESISALADEVISKVEADLKSVVNITDNERTFENTVEAFENAIAKFEDSVTIPIFLAYVSPDPEIRKASSELELKISQYSVDIFTREDLFNAINSYAKNTKENLEPVQKRLIDKFLFDFKQNGLYGDEKTRKKVKKLLKQLVEVQINFEKNLRETRDFIEVSDEELKGLDENYIKRLKKSDSGKYIVSTDYHEYMPFMDNAENDEARRRLDMAFINKGY